MARSRRQGVSKSTCLGAAEDASARKKTPTDSSRRVAALSSNQRSPNDPHSQSSPRDPRQTAAGRHSQRTLGKTRLSPGYLGNACRRDLDPLLFQRGGPTDSLGSRALAVRSSRCCHCRPPERHDLSHGRAASVQDRGQDGDQETGRWDTDAIRRDRRDEKVKGSVSGGVNVNKDNFRL